MNEWSVCSSCMQLYSSCFPDILSPSFQSSLHSWSGYKCHKEARAYLIVITSLKLFSHDLQLICLLPRTDYFAMYKEHPYKYLDLDCPLYFWNFQIFVMNYMIPFYAKLCCLICRFDQKASTSFSGDEVLALFVLRWLCKRHLSSNSSPCTLSFMRNNSLLRSVLLF